MPKKLPTCVYGSSVFKVPRKNNTFTANSEFEFRSANLHAIREYALFNTLLHMYSASERVIAIILVAANPSTSYAFLLFCELIILNSSASQVGPNKVELDMLEFMYKAQR